MKIVPKIPLALGALTAAIMLVGGYFAASAKGEDKAPPAPTRDPNVIVLTDDQAQHIPLGEVSLHAFHPKVEATGSVDFDEDTLAQISPPYAGRILQVFVKAGDSVSKGQPLFSIESPDLIQAESSLLSAAATATVAKNALARAEDLVKMRGMAQKDYDQAVADNQTAQAQLNAAREQITLFGKSAHDIDLILARQKVDDAMVVVSPIRGQVTARNAAPGSLVQPGSTPVPMSIADTSRKWVLSNVTEAEAPDVSIGERVDIRIDAFPGRHFAGKVDSIATALDPITRRAVIRTVVEDPKNELRPQMFASTRIFRDDPVQTLALPTTGVVREGDGTYVAWVTKDRREFRLRPIQVGLVEDGLQQVTSGLSSGETVATGGALFLDNQHVLNSQ